MYEKEIKHGKAGNKETEGWRKRESMSTNCDRTRVIRLECIFGILRRFPRINAHKE